jgi:aryl-alcohol dehydrogenase-like predicted oxidoreductase
MLSAEIEIAGLRGRVSRLALGTAGFGSSVSREDSFALLDAYAEAGGNFLDTANVYAEWLPDGKGKSEATIGAWLAARGTRVQTVIGTKGGHPDLATGRRRLNPEDLDRDLGESLDRLGVDRVDIYWFHRDDPAKRIGDILAWAAQQIADGRVGAVGCSNWSLARLKEANTGAGSRQNPAHFCANQVGWSLADRKSIPPAYPDLEYMNDSICNFHVATRLPLVAYSSQGTGFFGLHKRDDPGLAAAYGTPRNYQRRSLVDGMADRRGATQNQVALAWLWQHPFPVIPIVGPRTLAQLRDSLGAVGLRLAPEEVSLLSSPP